MNEKIKKLEEIIKESNNIVFLGGAGVSTESGLKDFRGQGGIYKQKYEYPAETILSHNFFFEHNEKFYDFYFKEMVNLNVKPNYAHYFLADLENFNIDINDFNITLELDSISVIKNLVSDNYGVSIIAKSSCLEDIKKGYFKMINVENLSMVREINLIYHQDFEHLDFINELIELYHSYNN